jgi:hypothetical protein
MFRIAYHGKTGGVKPIISQMTQMGNARGAISPQNQGWVFTPEKTVLYWREFYEPAGAGSLTQRATPHPTRRLTVIF